MYEVECSSPQKFQKLKDDCEKLLYYHVILTMTDGSTFDGIIEKVEEDQIIVLVGEDVIEQEETTSQRQFGGGGRRFRRFNRIGLPLAGLATLALLAYPYYRPYYYPYYPPYYYPY